MTHNLHRDVRQRSKLGHGGGYEGLAGGHVVTLPLDAGALLLVGAAKLGLVQTVDTLPAVLGQAGPAHLTPDLPSCNT